MYLKLNNYEYKITAANVGFEMSEDNKSLIMFLDIDGSYEGEDLDYELRTIRLYHNNGFHIGVKEPNKLIGKSFEWNEAYNNKGEEAGTLYVLEHEDVTSGKIDILDVTQDLIKVKWSGQANVFWNEECGENVSFEAEVEAKVPSVPKVKVINGFKETKLKIDKNTEIELLNFSDMVMEAERCKESYLKNDSNAWSTFDKALKLKLTYMKKEYYGEAVYQGSGTKCYTVFDDQCPLNVQITKTAMWIENEEYKFYILVEAKIE